MKIKKGKIEIDKTYLGFCLIRVLYHVYLCKLTFKMGNYRVEKESD